MPGCPYGFAVLPSGTGSSCIVRVRPGATSRPRRLFEWPGPQRYRAGPEVRMAGAPVSCVNRHGILHTINAQSVRPTTGPTTAAKRPPITPVIDLEGTL
eukprot:6528617-Prymnesium_polylepis.1